jgi:sec-independent protein translocase protein TatB
MFDMAWSEMAVIAVVALLVLGPKELPKAMRAVAKVMRQGRKLAGEFQVHVNDLIREADLQDVRKTIDSVRDEYADADKMFDPSGQLKDINNSLTKTKQDIAGALNSPDPAPAAAIPPPLEPETVTTAPSPSPTTTSTGTT